MAMRKPDYTRFPGGNQASRAAPQRNYTKYNLQYREKIAKLELYFAELTIEIVDILD